MKPDFYKKKWLELKKKPDVESLKRLSSQTALSFLDQYFYNDRYNAEYIGILCEMATFFNDSLFDKAAASALFGIVIEGLCDDFEELQTEAYNRVMSQVVSFCRGLRRAKELDKTLNDFGLTREADIFRRIETLRKNSGKRRKFIGTPKKILLLSRVTIGADVAITSVIIQRLNRIFPDAEMILIGDKKINGVFGGNPCIRISNAEYSRRGGLLERFASWRSVIEVVNREILETEPENVILIDPDSRFSQLGVLPLVKNENYLFFNSRGDDSFPKKVSVAELANHWIDRVFGESEFCYPMIWLPEKTLGKASSFAGELRKRGCRKIIALNFGAGGNSRKMIEGDFEKILLLSLLKTPHTAVLLDKGFGGEELLRSNNLMNTARNSGYFVSDTAFDLLSVGETSGGLYGIKSGIGEVAALIAQSDEFIGYDSACQHIAAALGIPTFTVFAGTNNPKFIRRWAACGTSKSEIIHVDTLTHPLAFETNDIVERITDAREG